jgi:hypothetical protein
MIELSADDQAALAVAIDEEAIRAKLRELGRDPETYKLALVETPKGAVVLATPAGADPMTLGSDPDDPSYEFAVDRETGKILQHSISR